MKFWIKILVAFLVVVTIGFAIWAFFFREKDEVVAYNRTAEFLDYKYSTDIHEEINSLIKFDYLNDNESNKLDGDNTIANEILNIRQTCLNVGDIVHKEDDVEKYRYQSYYMLEKMTDDIIYANLPYLKGNKVDNSAKRQIQNNVDEYISNIGNLSVAIKELKDCQNSITGTDIELEFLLGKYRLFRDNYRKYLNSASNLIIAMQDYINSSLYGNDVKFDVAGMLYDSFARNLNTMTSVDLREEIDRALSLNKIYKLIYKNSNGYHNVLDGYAEYEVLQAYNLLINNYIDNLNFVFSKSYYDKTEMAKGNNLSLIKNEAQSSVKLVLKALGF